VGAVAFAAVGTYRLAIAAAALAVFVFQLWWGRRELRVNPAKPGAPVGLGSPLLAILGLGSLVVVGVAFLPDPRAVALLVFRL
jgi:hypothetical protein